MPEVLILKARVFRLGRVQQNTGEISRLGASPELKVSAPSGLAQKRSARLLKIGSTGVPWMSVDLVRLNSYLFNRFQVSLVERADGQLAPTLLAGELAWLPDLNSFVYRPRSGNTFFELRGDHSTILALKDKLTQFFDVFLEGWLEVLDLNERSRDLETHMLHQVFHDKKKILPFRRKNTSWQDRSTPPTRPVEKSPQTLKKPWLAILGSAQDALMIGQEISRLLNHSFFLRITTPGEWIEHLDSPGSLENTTVVLELEKFPQKSFLLKERPRALGPTSFLVLQSSSTKKLASLPHLGSDFLSLQAKLRERFHHKYLRDCARIGLGLNPLYRLSGSSVDTNQEFKPRPLH